MSHLINKIFNHIGLMLSASLKNKETPVGKMLPHKGSAGLARKIICNYRAEVVILSYLQGWKNKNVDCIEPVCTIQYQYSIDAQDSSKVGLS